MDNNNSLTVFNYEDQEVRTVQKDGETWWVLKDVCDILGLCEPHRVAARLEKDERTQMTIIDNLGRPQNTTIINEPGLYKVILRSDKPEAKKFTNWVTHEVLPSIRKYGAYMTPDTLLDAVQNPENLHILISALCKSQERNQELDEKNQKLNAELETCKPKVLFAQTVEAAETTITVGELAKILKGNGVDIGRNRLFKVLRKENFIMSEKIKESNMPTQKSMNLGLFKINETTITHSDGRATISKTLKVTGKGQVYLIPYLMDLLGKEEKHKKPELKNKEGNLFFYNSGN